VNEKKKDYNINSMWNLKGNIENTTITKLVWCVMQCTSTKTKATFNLSYEITPMWCPWNTKFSSKPRHTHLKPKSSSKIPPYLDCNNTIYSSIHFHMFQVPRLVSLELNSNISQHTHGH
jgi:hypothetical protein